MMSDAAELWEDGAEASSSMTSDAAEVWEDGAENGAEAALKSAALVFFFCFLQ